MTTLENKIINPIEYLNKLKENTTFEYDDEVVEFCCYFNNVEGYFGQGKTKAEAFIELLSCYLDTKDL